MRFPVELWETDLECQIIRQFLDAFAGHPVMLTDKLANTVFFTPEAEELLADRGEAIVNRLSFSLMGFGSKDRVPPGLTAALLGESVPWRGVVNLSSDDSPRLRFAEASAIRSPGRFLCGVVRFSASPASP
ncbi:hypothetical protein IT570_02255 [Candidatus Sumerlaeota bacterium]|nr:hypothetical protein [Candidatus Sumerlaeota bacterium]